jgi:C1A family cysteine protease
MADWTEAEYKKLLGFKPTNQTQDLANYHIHVGDIPASVDWRTQGAVTPVKNQGQCGSCWSFSTTGAMEGRYFLKNKNLVSFSEQQFVDCSTENNGCNGGLMTLAFKYAQSAAIDTEAQYPYTGTQGTCNIPAAGVAKVASYQTVDSKSELALRTALASGPVSVAVSAGSLGFQFYSKGILSLLCAGQLDHGVLAVGYGSENGKGYWIVKNSWGPNWGENGYLRIARKENDKTVGTCGIQNGYNSYPIF